MWTIVTMIILLIYTLKMEMLDQQKSVLTHAGDSLDEEQLIYMHTLKQYPHWRICFIGGLISTLLIRCTVSCSLIQVDTRIYPVIFLIQYIILGFLIKYFQNMIMAKGI